MRIPIALAMSLKLTAAAVLCAWASLIAHAQAQRPFYSAGPLESPRIAALAKAVENNNPSAVTAFWEEARKATTPLIEPVSGEPQYSWVTFVWQQQGNTLNVAIIDGVAGGIGGPDPAKSLMTHLSGTDIWYRTYKVRNDGVFHYWFSPNDSLESIIREGPPTSKRQGDPLNPRRLGPFSYVELSSPRDESLSPVPAPHGKLEKTSFRSDILRNERTVWVYTPPGYQASASSYPLLVVLDGGAYLNLVQVPAILDRLIAEKRIPPIVAALVDNVPGRRDIELDCNSSFADFLANEIVASMRKNYRATSDPALTFVGGSSAGGLASAFAALKHPEVFGNVLSQSGAYWWSPPDELEKAWLIKQFAQSPKQPVTFSMSAGLMEVDDILGLNRQFRNVLIAKGYAVQYSEFNGNHSYVAWRHDFADRLAALLAGAKSN